MLIWNHCIAQRVAIAALWLASKLEEAPKKFRDVLVVFARIDSRAEERPPELLDPNSQVLARLTAKCC
jgi:cyclin L